MKSRIKATTLFVILLYTSFSYTQTFKTYETSIHDITYSINPKIELFNIVAMQMGRVPMSLSNLAYKQQSIQEFTTFKDHYAIATLIETAQKGWGIDDPIMFLLYLNDDFTISKNIDESVVKRGGGIAQLQKLAKALKDFAIDSNFEHYFNVTQASFYNQVLTNINYNFRDFKVVNTLEDYYGEKANSYNLILNLIGGYGNFGKQIKTNNSIDLFAVVETTSSYGEIPVYQPSVSTTDLILHEFSHGFINPITDKNAELLMQEKQLLDPIKKQMKSQAYTNWKTVANEHIVRASVVRLAEKYFGKNVSELIYYKRAKSRSFIYLDKIIEKLKLYENNRNKYQAITSFSNELIASFTNSDSTYISEQLTTSETLHKYKNIDIPKPYDFAEDKSTLFIVSSQEKDTIAQNKMIAFAKRYKNMLSENSQIITDKEALKRDLSQNDILVFGTVEGNLFLKKHIDKIPIKITKAEIIINKVIHGKHLQLVTSWVNPYNNDKAMVIYTAQQVEDINNFHFSQSKDNYHYWVAQNLTPIDKGDYKKYYNVWMPNFFKN